MSLPLAFCKKISSTSFQLSAGSKDHIRVQGEILEGLVARIVSHESSKHIEQILRDFPPPQLEGGKFQIRIWSSFLMALVVGSAVKPESATGIYFLSFCRLLTEIISSGIRWNLWIVSLSTLFKSYRNYENWTESVVLIRIFLTLRQNSSYCVIVTVTAIVSVVLHYYSRQIDQWLYHD